MRTITLTPAYGRDYKNSNDVKRDWYKGRDFILHDTTSIWDGKPANIESLKDHVGDINIRYNKLRRVVVVGGLNGEVIDGKRSES